MKTELVGIVTKAVGGVFTVFAEKYYTCFSPKKFRYAESDVLVGDKVRFQPLDRGKGVVTEVLPRKNKMKRPEIANVDVAFVVVAPEPQPDFYLVDKVIVNCYKSNIMPVIVVNKIDISETILSVVTENYGKIADVVALSAIDGTGVDELKKYIEGKSVCFAGQSAVGKTSLLNCLLPEADGATGGLSQKTGRGMHTTRHSRVYPVFGGFVADTCGFSLCDVSDVRSDELRLYFDDMVELSHSCRYGSCTHTVEPDCAVMAAVQAGEFCKARYERYVEEFNELKENEKKKYG